MLDHTPGTAKVLPGIAKEMKGKIAIIADGGNPQRRRRAEDAGPRGRRGHARQALQHRGHGRPDRGVANYAQTLRTELMQAMVMTGTRAVTQLPANILWNGPRA